MVQLTVGYVAGMIAAGIFVGMSLKMLSPFVFEPAANRKFSARLWSPNALAFILSGRLRDKNPAATL